MNLTLGEMVTLVKDFTKAPDSLVPLIKSEINLAYDDIARSQLWDELVVRYGDTHSPAFKFVAGKAYLALPADAVQPLAIASKTSDWYLVPKDESQVVKDNIAYIDTSGAVVYYSNLGIKPVKQPLSAADKLAVLTEVDTDASKDVRVTGVRSDIGSVDQETVTTDSSAPSTTSSASSLTYAKGWSIYSISTGDHLNGWVKVVENATQTNVLAYLTEHQRSSGYCVLLLENPPDTADNLVVSYKRAVPPLRDDGDTPVIPVSHGIVELVRAKLREADRQYEEGAVHKSDAMRSIGAALTQGKSQRQTVFQYLPNVQQRQGRRSY